MIPPQDSTFEFNLSQQRCVCSWAKEMSPASQSTNPKSASRVLSGPARNVKVSLAVQVADSLRGAILRNELKPGTRLVELEIAEQMGTSQTPVREALQRLEQDSLVTRRSHSATYVTEVSMGEMYEIALMRRLVEGIAIRHTARCITAEQCDELEELVAHMRKAAASSDMPTIADYDMRFHSRICEWSGRATLVRVLTPLIYQVQRFLIVVHPNVFPALSEIADLHTPIVTALRQKEAGEAATAVEDHIMKYWNEESTYPCIEEERLLHSWDGAAR